MAHKRVLKKPPRKAGVNAAGRPRGRGTTTPPPGGDPASPLPATSSLPADALVREHDVSLQMERLAHELHVHQEELEIQNRQLVESQQLLEASRDRYANLYDFAPVPYVTFCAQGVIREINLPGAELLGHPRDRLVDRPFVLFVAEPYRQSFLNHLSRCRQNSRPITTELVLRMKGRREVPVELRTSEGTLKEHDRTHFLSVLIDLTERRRLEQEREQLQAATRSEQLLRTILETLPIAVRVVGAGGKSLLFNEACRSLWGIPADAPLPPWDHQRGWDAQTRQRLLKADWPVARALRGSRDGLRQVIHAQGFDGNLRIVVQSAVPLVDEAGAVTGAVEVTEDVTRLMGAQDAARRRQEQLEAAFESAHLSFWDWQLDTDRVTWSGPLAQVISPGNSEAVVRPGEFLAHVVPEDAAQVQAAIELAREQRLPYEHEFRVVYPDGGMRWCAAKGGFIYQGNRPVRMNGVVMDVTARKAAELELRQAKEAAELASRLKDDFLATVSHELRTPLSAILLWAHLARTTFKTEAEKENALDVITQSAKAQSQIVDDLLDVSRGIAGKLRLNLRDAALAPPVRAAIDTVRPSAEARQIQLSAEIFDNSVMALIDPDRIQQVAWNLLSNAIKFTPPGGRVTLILQTHAPQGGGGGGGTPVARLMVSDTGQGIAPEFLPFLFDRFRQADSGITRSHGGLGLGLAIARELVQMHGGTIEAQSEGAGRGATFIVDLPLPIESTGAMRPSGAAAPAAAAVAPATRSAGGELRGVDVLLVEDEPDTRTALGRLLEEAGATVRTAESAAAALDAFQQSRPDVLVSDIAMPGQDGYALLRRVRQIEAEHAVREHKPGKAHHVSGGAAKGQAARSSEADSNEATKGSNGNTPALALTAHALPQDRARATAAGFQAHLAKPVEPANLIAAVATLCHGRGSSANDAKAPDPVSRRPARRSRRAAR